MNKEEPKVLTRMRLSCCWGDNLNKEELNEIVDYINNLEKENKQQQERIAYLERSNNRREQQIIEQRDEIIELECIRDKAIEYINNHELVDEQGIYIYKCSPLLLEILKGNDNE